MTDARNTAFVTGGSGLVGTHVLYDLTRSGRTVKALKREGSNLKIVQRVFNFYDPENGASLFDKIEWIDGDLMDVLALEEGLSGVNEVYHCAALVSFHKSDDEELMRVNVDGTSNIVNAALSNGVQKFCHVSSTAAIGRKAKKKEINEQTPWKKSKHNSMYAISKFLAEREVWRGAEEGLDIAIVNPAIIIGPGDWSRSSGTIFQKVWTGFKFYTYGVNGFIDARDVSKAMISLLDRNIFRERYLVVSENLNFKQYFDLVAWSLGKPAASIKANRIITSIAWRAMMIKSKLTGKKPSFTRHNARSTHSRRFYSNEKLRKQLGIDLIPVKSAVQNAGNFFKEFATH